MGLMLPPRRAIKEERREIALADCAYILEQREWLPVYEEGGLDALIEAGELPRYPLPDLDPSTYRK